MSGTQQAVRAAFEKGYRVNDQGQVISRLGKIRALALKVHRTGDRRHVFTIQMERNKFFPIPVHRLLAFQLFGDAAFGPGIEVRHLDGNSLNNTPSNIALGTKSQNEMDKPAANRRLQAQKAGKVASRHTDETWEQVRADHATGMSYKKLRKKYGISLGALSYQLSKTATRQAMR